MQEIAFDRLVKGMGWGAAGLFVLVLAIAAFRSPHVEPLPDPVAASLEAQKTELEFLVAECRRFARDRGVRDAWANVRDCPFDNPDLQTQWKRGWVSVKGSSPERVAAVEEKILVPSLMAGEDVFIPATEGHRISPLGWAMMFRRDENDAAKLADTKRYFAEACKSDSGLKKQVEVILGTMPPQ